MKYVGSADRDAHLYFLSSLLGGSLLCLLGPDPASPHEVCTMASETVREVVQGLDGKHVLKSTYETS